MLAVIQYQKSSDSVVDWFTTAPSIKRRINTEMKPFKYPVCVSILLASIISLGCFGGTVNAGSFNLNNGLETLTLRISNEMDMAQMHYIGVVDFSDLNGSTSELGVFISEELTTRLHDTQKFKLVERRLLYKVIEEQRLGLSGLLDEKSVKVIGKILGVDSLCTGTITDLGETFKVNARMISVETGQIFAVAAVEINKNDAIRILMRKYTQIKQDAERLQQKSNKATKMNLLINGGFTQDLTGWKRTIGDINQGVSNTEIIPNKNFSSGRMLHMVHRGNGSIQLSQIVPVPTADLVLTATFQFSTREGYIKAFSGSGVAQFGLVYLDHKGTKVGQTIVLNYVKNPFADTPLIGVPRRASDTYMTHYIEVDNNKLYTNYRLDIRREIENNLLGIDPESIEEIGVVIWCGANHSDAAAELWITDIYLSYR